MDDIRKYKPTETHLSIFKGARAHLHQSPYYNFSML